VVHLFFDCVVAKRAWEMISVVFGIETGRDYYSIAKMWLCNKKIGVCNMFTSATCWGL
jgi:hypothetical protein